MSDVPLNRKWKIIVADFLEIALLPDASVDEGDIVLGKRENYVLQAVDPAY